MESLVQLRTRIGERLLLPGDAGFEQARLGWNRVIEHHPALILVATGVQDIVEGVRYAREAGIGIGVQLTGHGTQQPVDAGLLIVMSAMNAVEVDQRSRIARIAAGAMWQDVLDQATPYGLAPLLGTSPHVGVVGYTLGGGIGWLARRYGLAADHVRWIELVTADGELRRASATENSELFWGLRGAGGSLGVITALEFDLFPVATLYGGMLAYPGTLARDALRFYRDWIATAPDELTSMITVIKFPALPAIPEALRGTAQVILKAAYAGGADAGAALIQAWLDWNTPLNNTFGELSFAQVGRIANESVEPQSILTSSEMFDALSDAAIDVIVRTMIDSDAPLFATELRHAGGAITHGSYPPNAIGNRDALLYMGVGGMTPTPVAHLAVKAAIQRYKTALRPELSGGVYLNFLKGDEAGERAQDAYEPDSYERLLTLKAQYDPDNLFRYGYQLGAAAPVHA